MTKLEFLEKIDDIVSRFNGSITSWRRSKKHNDEIGGHPNSRHLYGWAVDVVLDNSEDTLSFINECERQRLKAINESSHIHVQKGD